MGKKIIVKGADFSANGFRFSDVLTLTEEDCTIENKGLYAESGELSNDSFTAWKSSDFIDIEDLSLLTFISVSPAVSFGLSFYSTNNVSGFISGIKYATVVAGTTIDLPANAKYIRFCSSSATKLTVLTLQ